VTTAFDPAPEYFLTHPDEQVCLTVHVTCVWWVIRHYEKVPTASVSWQVLFVFIN